MTASLGRLSLAGKTAVVTGAASGIGAQSAMLMAARGARVLVADIDTAGAQETVRAITDAGGSAAVCRADVGRSEDIAAMIAMAVDRFSRLDVLVNNAFFQTLGSVEQLTEEDWDRSMDVTLKSVFRACKQAIPHIRKSGGGAIVNISSMHAITGFRGFAVYQAAKGGVSALTRQMAVDYGREGIRVNAILPGPTVTGAFAKVPDSYVEAARRRMPLLRPGRPDETAEVVAFLASDAASLVTGVNLPVDGGATIVGEPDWLDEKPVILP